MDTTLGNSASPRRMLPEVETRGKKPYDISIHAQVLPDRIGRCVVDNDMDVIALIMYVVESVDMTTRWRIIIAKNDRVGSIYSLYLNTRIMMMVIMMMCLLNRNKILRKGRS